MSIESESPLSTEIAHSKNLRLDKLRTALGYAREKLILYRMKVSGEYVGGIEYTALLKMIAEALKD